MKISLKELRETMIWPKMISRKRMVGDEGFFDFPIRYNNLVASEADRIDGHFTGGLGLFASRTD